MTILQLDTLDVQRLVNLYPEITGGQRCAELLCSTYETVRIKPARHAPYGVLKPLQVLFRTWSSISLDLVIGLPNSNGFDILLVVVD